MTNSGSKSTFRKQKDFHSSQIEPILYHCTDNKVVETSLDKIRVGNFLGNGQHLYLHIPVQFLPQIELIPRKKKINLKQNKTLLVFLID